MTSKHLVDPALLGILDAYPRGQFSNDTMPQIRESRRLALAAMRKPEDSAAAAVIVEERSVPGAPGSPDVRLLIFRQGGAKTQGNAAPLPAVLFVHGGGYILGGPDMALVSHRKRVADLGCVWVSVDYRLAPETPHPGPIDDCYAALSWLHHNAAELGVESSRIGVSGESAGAGLAASLALLARDRGEFPLAFQHLIYPMIDDRTSFRPDPHPYAGEFVWTNESNRYGWNALLSGAAGGSDVSAYAAAARAQDLKRLPPTFVAVGALDLFLEENLEYVRRLTRAGVPVELHVYPGAFHGFQRAEEAAVAVAAERDSRNALWRLLSKSAVT